MKNEVNSKFYNIEILKIYVSYLGVELKWTDIQIKNFFRDIDVDYSLLSSNDNWFGQDLANKFIFKLEEKTGDKDIAYRVGKYTTEQSSRGIGGMIFSGLLSPQVAFRNINRVGQMYSKGAEYLPKEVSKDRARILVRPINGCKEEFYQCRNRSGILEAIPKFFKRFSCKIEHEKCFHKGDDYCEYIITWKNPFWATSPLYGLMTVLAVFATAVLISDSFAKALSYAGFLAIVLYAITQKKRLDFIGKILTDEVSSLENTARLLIKRNSESELINEVLKTSSSFDNLYGLAKSLVGMLVSQKGYDRCIFFQVDLSRNILGAVCHEGFDDSFKDTISAMEFNLNSNNSTGYLVSAVNTKKSVLISDTSLGLANLSNRSQKYITSLQIKSLAVVPINYKDNILGVLTVENTQSHNPIGTDDVEFLEKIATHVSVVIENVRNFQKLKGVLDITIELERKQREQKDAFKKFVPFVLNGDETMNSLETGNLRMESVGIMFIDIVGFTFLCEKNSLEDIAETLNMYIDVIQKNSSKFGGVINKIIGDGLMIIFENNPRLMIDAGLAIKDSIGLLTQSCPLEGELCIGIGAHIGECIIGTIGCDTRLDYTLLGDNVNIASRIESYTRQVGVNEFCVSESVAKYSVKENIVKIDSIKLKGKSEEIDIYRVIAGK